MKQHAPTPKSEDTNRQASAHAGTAAASDSPRQRMQRLQISQLQAPAAPAGPVAQRLCVGDEDLDLMTIAARIQANVNTPWHPEYNKILLEFELNDDRFTSMIDLIMGLGSMMVGSAYRTIDPSGYEADIEDNDLPDEVDEPAILSKFNLDSKKLYRAEDFADDELISKENTMLYGFFSTSLDYAKQYLKGGEKGDYKSFICVTLSRPIGNILIELIRSRDAFTQNSGAIKGLLEEHAGVASTQKRVQKKREAFASKNYKSALIGGDRKNAPNAVMIKSEPLGNTSVANLEITTRLKDITKDRRGVLVEHPLDKYVLSIDRLDAKSI